MNRQELEKAKDELAGDARMLHDILQITLQKVKDGEIQVSASLLRELTVSIKNVKAFYDDIETMVDAADDEPTEEEQELMEEFARIEASFESDTYVKKEN